MTNGRATPVAAGAAFDAPKIQYVPRRTDSLTERLSVIAEGVSWIGTKYHHRGKLKKTETDLGGVDCAQLPYMVYRNCNLLPELDFGHYPADWFLHQGAERYLPWVSNMSDRVDLPGPGDFVLYKVGRLFAHGAIVVEWPHRVIHAARDVGFVLEANGVGGNLADREHMFFSIWK